MASHCRIGDASCETSSITVDTLHGIAVILPSHWHYVKLKLDLLALLIPNSGRNWTKCLSTSWSTLLTSSLLAYYFKRLLPRRFLKKTCDTPSRNTPPRRSEWGSSLSPDCFVSRGSVSTWVILNIHENLYKLHPLPSLSHPQALPVLLS
jgi:hypothetical protein